MVLGVRQENEKMPGDTVQGSIIETLQYLYCSSCAHNRLDPFVVWRVREHMEPFSLSGKVAIVTGAYFGIGRAAAVLLAQNGARVALVLPVTGKPRKTFKGTSWFTGSSCRHDKSFPDQAYG